MHPQPTDANLTDRLVNTLHLEAMVLADEVRAYFDDAGRAERDALAPLDRVTFSCESLKVTTRLMHVIGWLLSRRAATRDGDADTPRMLGHVAPTDPVTIAALPATAQALIAASCELHVRAARLEAEVRQVEPQPVPSPARSLLSRLERAF